MDPISGAVITGGVIVVVVVLALMAISRLVIIVPPNEAAVITGRARKVPGTGETIGYRSVIGGRTLRIPILEQVEYVSLESIPIEISVSNAYSKGNIPLTIEAIANVKIASEPETVFNNAVERLLDKPFEEIR